MKRFAFFFAGILAALVAVASPALSIAPGQRVPILLGQPKKSLLQQLPAGVTGLWIMDQVVTSGPGVVKPYVPNVVNAATPPSKNLINWPRRMFATGGGGGVTNSTGYGSFNATVTDLNQVGPDGQMEASSLVTKTPGSDSFIQNTITLATGSYLFAVDVRSLTGSNQSFRIGDSHGAGSYTTETATTSWQTFTFPLTSTGTSHGLLVGSPDQTSAINLAFTNFRVFQGSSDLGPDVQVGHMYFGANFNEPSQVSSGIFVGGTTYGVASFGAETSYNQGTTIAIGRKVRNAHGGNNGLVTSGQDNSYFSIWGELSSDPSATLGPAGANIALTTAPLNHVYPANWNYLNFGWGAKGFQYNEPAGLGSLWVDDIKLFNRSPMTALAGVVQDFIPLGWVGNDAGSVNLSDYDIAVTAQWSRTLSDSEYRTAYNLLLNRVLPSIGSAATERIILYEGDSIFANVGNASNGGIVGVSAAAQTPVNHGYNQAVSGNEVPNLVSRLTALPYEAQIPWQGNGGGRKFIYVFLIGANDLGGESAATFASTVASLYTQLKADGFTNVVMCSVLPNEDPDIFNGTTYEQRRQQANAIFRAASPGTYFDAFVDFAPITGDGAYGSGSISAGVLTLDGGVTGTPAIGQQIVQQNLVTTGVTITSGSGNTWNLSSSVTAADGLIGLIPWIATNTVDGVHPNNAGAAAVAPTMTTVIDAQ